MLRLGLLHRAAGCGLLLSKITNLLFLASTKTKAYPSFYISILNHLLPFSTNTSFRDEFLIF